MNKEDKMIVRKKEIKEDRKTERQKEGENVED